MNSRTGPSFGLPLADLLRSGGIALASACRTTRRCVLNFLATPRMVPTPNRYSRRICSNSSTLRLLSIGLPVARGSRRQIRPIRDYRWGQIKSAKRGQIRVSKSAPTVLTMHTESHYILQGVRAGAKGVVLKTHASEDLVRAIREASRGGTYMSSQVSSALVQAWATTPARWSAGRARRPAINRQIKGW